MCRHLCHCNCNSYPKSILSILSKSFFITRFLAKNKLPSYSKRLIYDNVSKSRCVTNSRTLILILKTGKNLKGKIIYLSQFWSVRGIWFNLSYVCIGCPNLFFHLWKLHVLSDELSRYAGKWNASIACH